MVDHSEETPISVHHRTLEEIAWYLKKMQGFPVRQIAVKATNAVTEWQKGNRKPGLDVLIQWYNTLRRGTNHTLNEGCGKPLNMEEVLIGSDNVSHMDLLVQIIVTLKSQ